MTVSGRVPLSVLWVGPVPPHQGGSATHAAQIVVGLARRGHRVRVVAPITPEALETGDRFAAAHPELAVTRFLVPHYDVSPDHVAAPGYREQEARGLRHAVRSLLAAEPPHVLVLGRSLFALPLWGLGGVDPRRTVVVVHGTAETGVSQGSLPMAVGRDLFARLREAACLLPVARHLGALLRSLGLEAVRVVENVVDVEQFRPAPASPDLMRTLGIARGDVVAAHLSNLKAAKQPLDIVWSAERALHRVPALRYLVVGDGPLRRSMEELVAARGLAPHFRFVGWVPHEAVPEYLNVADLILMPSAFEGQALICLEAQACGRLVVASDVPGARELITDGANGLLVRAGDVEDLTTATTRAALDPALRAAIGARAHAMVQARGPATAVDAYEAILANVADGARAGPVDSCRPP